MTSTDKHCDRRRHFGSRHRVLLLIFLLGHLSTFAKAADQKKRKVCELFTCENEHETPVQKRPMKIQSAGCSTVASGGVESEGLVPPNAGKYLGICCDRRQVCANLCGSDRRTCDDAFRKCITEACGLHIGESREECVKEAKGLLVLIGLGGCLGFQNAQHAACTCVPEEKASEHRETLVRKFYKKYSPDSGMGKVTSLVRKIDSSAKFAALFTKLVEKFPHAIKKTAEGTKPEDDVQNLKDYFSGDESKRPNKPININLSEMGGNKGGMGGGFGNKGTTFEFGGF